VSSVGLPNSREATFVASSKVLSAVLNKIQDMIIGAKHPEIARPIHPSAFRAEAGNPVFAGHHWEGNAGALFALFAPLLIPVGTRMTHVKFSYDRKNAGTVTVGWVILNLSTGAFNALGGSSFADGVAGLGTTYHDIAAQNYTVGADEALCLTANIDAPCSAAGGLFYGATPFVDRL